MAIGSGVATRIASPAEEKTCLISDAIDDDDDQLALRDARLATGSIDEWIGKVIWSNRRS